MRVVYYTFVIIVTLIIVVIMSCLLVELHLRIIVVFFPLSFCTACHLLTGLLSPVSRLARFCTQPKVKLHVFVRLKRGKEKSIANLFFRFSYENEMKIQVVLTLLRERKVLETKGVGF